MTESPDASKKVLFIFDRVMHYHLDLFRTLAVRLERHGVELHLASGSRPSGAKGRVAVAEQVIQRETKFKLRDRKIGRFGFSLALGYVLVAWRLRPDVVVCPAHVGDLGHWALIAMKWFRRFRLVSWLCGYEYNPGRMKGWLLRIFVPAFDYHLAYHGNARRYALQHGDSDERIRVIHNTINEAKFEVTPKAAAVAAVNRLHPQVNGRRIVLYVGAILEEKNLERAVSAIRVLGRNDVVLMVVGDGPHLPALMEFATGTDRVVFAGQVIEGVGVFFDAAEVYILPGTGGLGINEAMAHSLPIISGFADGSADDLVVDGENGFRLREESLDELKQRIEWILDHPAEAAAMGAKSREWITGKFSFQHFLERVEEAIMRETTINK
jgi:glycosyltransferase involved in cell wall biosynthesis